MFCWAKVRENTTLISNSQTIFDHDVIYAVIRCSFLSLRKQLADNPPANNADNHQNYESEYYSFTTLFLFFSLLCFYLLRNSEALLVYQLAPPSMLCHFSSLEIQTTIIAEKMVAIAPMSISAISMCIVIRYYTPFL